MKKHIPKALKTAVWLTYVGRKFDTKCYVSWCKTIITPFSFETGHNIPESKGGETSVANLRPICAMCNKSMGNRYSIDEFSRIYDSNRDKRGSSKLGKFFNRLSNCMRPASGAIAPEPDLIKTNSTHLGTDARMTESQSTTSESADTKEVPSHMMQIRAARYRATQTVSSKASNNIPLPNVAYKKQSKDKDKDKDNEQFHDATSQEFHSI